MPRGGEWGWRGGGGRGGGRDGVVRGEGGFGGALEAFELGLLGGRETRGRGGGLEGGGLSEGARRLEGCESAEGAEEAGHFFLVFILVVKEACCFASVQLAKWRVGRFVWEWWCWVWLFFGLELSMMSRRKVTSGSGIRGNDGEGWA